MSAPKKRACMRQDLLKCNYSLFFSVSQIHFIALNTAWERPCEKKKNKKQKKKRCAHESEPRFESRKVRRTRTQQSGYRGAGGDFLVDFQFYDFIRSPQRKAASPGT